ncbi:MAG: hypothetical protein V4689_06970 [Verrucomicrobiota bacterium]
MLQKISIGILAAFFTVAGANHFISPGTYLPMMPDYLPWHLTLVYASGMAEMAGGIGICFSKWRRLAGWGLIALLIAIFPANVHMLTHQVPLNGKNIPEWILWARLPLQAVMIAWVYLSCVGSRKP